MENIVHIQHPLAPLKTLCGNDANLVILGTYKESTCASCRATFGPLPKPYQSNRTHTRDDF